MDLIVVHFGVSRLLCNKIWGVVNLFTTPLYLRGGKIRSEVPKSVSDVMYKVINRVTDVLL